MNYYNVDMTFEALHFATLKHHGQVRRKGRRGEPGYQEFPYIIHPIEVMMILRDAGVSNGLVLAAALLHDTVEDTNTTIEEVRDRFGDQIALIVGELTDDPKLTKEQQREAQVVKITRMSNNAALVKVADQICNVRDMYQRNPGWKKENILAYIEKTKRVVDAAQGQRSEFRVPMATEAYLLHRYYREHARALEDFV